MLRSLALLAVLALGVVGCSKQTPEPGPAPAADLKPQPEDGGEREPIRLDVNEQGNVLLAQGRTIDSPEKLREVLLLQAKMETLLTSKDRPQATLLLRVDKATPFAKIREILAACHRAGYEKLQFRLAGETDPPIDLTLPRVEAGATATIPDLFEERREEIRIEISKAGEIRQSTPARPEGKTFENAEQLGRSLRRMADEEKRFAREDRPQTTIFLRPDEATRIDRVLAVVTACRSAGYSNVQIGGTHREEILTNEDPGLDSKIEAALPEINRIDRATVEAVVSPDNIGQPKPGDPNLPNLDPPGLPGLDDPKLEPGVLGGAGGLGLQDTFANRQGATKAKLVKDAGGNDASERAVALGLAWLAKQQKANGSWVFDGGDKDEVIAATGMALLPFLAAGETHKAGKKYQKTVKAGLDFLKSQLPLGGANAGRFTGTKTMYGQAIGTLALVEAYGMTKDKAALLAPAQAAVNFIQRQQGPNGSWGYSVASPSNGDTSIVGWQIQALHAAILSKDIVVDQRVVKKAIQFLDAVAGGERKATYGYTDNAGAKAGTSLTAVGLWCRIHIDGWDPKNAGLVEGVEGLVKRGPAKDGKQPDMYFTHYATQVMRNFGGEEWKTWNEGPKQADGTRKGGLRDTLIGLQIKKDGDTKGSWDPDGAFIGRSCGRHGTTALNILALEVYYRSLPPKR